MYPQRIATITWCQGLYVPVILDAVLSGAKTLGGFSQGKLVPGEQPGLERLTDLT